MDRWIEISTEIVNWQFYKDTKVFKLFLHLLICLNDNKNYKDTGIPFSRKQLSQFTGLSEQELRTALAKLVDNNIVKVQSTNSGSTLHILSLSEFIYLSSDQPTQPTNPVKSTNKNNQPNQPTQPTNDIDQIIDTLNTITGRNFKKNIKNTRDLISRRLKEGFLFSDFELVIKHKKVSWGTDDNMSTYLRPQTLFGSKFESYLQEARKQDLDFIVFNNGRIDLNASLKNIEIPTHTREQDFLKGIWDELTVNVERGSGSKDDERIL